MNSIMNVRSTQKNSAAKATMVVGMLASVMAGALVGCSKAAPSFSTLSQTSSFAQATSNNKVDVLWVIDNSFSMDPLQANLVSNFSQFINTFQSRNFDFNMTFTTTDAYLSEANFRNDPSFALIRDGAGSNHSGFFYISPSTPNLVQNFVTNATQGSLGSGDERAFSSMLDAMKNPANMGMLRKGAFLAVIILSDEDDFTDPNRPEGSWLTSGGIPDHDYTNPGLPAVDSVIAQLDSITSSTSASRNYNVSAITVMDNTCMTSHLANSPSTIVGSRYIELANKTGGVLGSVCDTSFATSLAKIQSQIATLATQFQLDRVPDVRTISVVVNGSVIPQDATNGWTYVSTSNSIQFHGAAIPPAGASIQVSFEPATIL
jgi:hypothetical protein